MNVSCRVFACGLAYLALAYLALVGVARSDQFAGEPFAGSNDAGHSAGGANWMADGGLLAGYPLVNIGGLDAPPLPGCDAIDPGCAAECSPPWAHRSGVFGELLYLRARDAEVAYAVPVDGAIVAPPSSIQVGRVAVTDPDYNAGFRVGGTCAVDDCSSFSLSWAHFESSTFDDATTSAPLVLRSLVLHPGTANAGADFLDAEANLDIDFDLVDGDYRAVWTAGDLWAINYLAGLRYAYLNQDFSALMSNTGTEDTLQTRVTFEGVGLRFGLDGERHFECCGMFLYGKTVANMIVGDFRARYTQGSDVDPIIVDTTWKAGRLVTVLDLELGAGWQSECGHWRLSTGYLISAWYNAIPTDQWIAAVQQNNFVNLGHEDMMTFDGLTARVEYRW